MLVIGLGRFGSALAVKLAQLGNEVMVIDRFEEKVTAVAPFVTASQIGDCSDEDILRSVGVDNFDICFVCVSDDFQSSLEITSQLKELGARHIVSKTEREKQEKFLHIIGADDVIHAERDMAQRLAVKYSARSAFEYIELTPEYAILEIEIPKSWIGRSVSDVDVRSKYNVNIIGLKRGNEILPLIKPDHIFVEDEHLIIAGDKKSGLRVMDKV